MIGVSIIEGEAGRGYRSHIPRYGYTYEEHAGGHGAAGCAAAYARRPLFYLIFLFLFFVCV